MQIREFSKPVTSKQLNESLAKKFGYKLNLEQFTNEQLEDARNKLRTKISQFELSESFDSVLENQEYQKTRLFLDCINQEIMEREESKEETCSTCHKDPCVCDENEDHKHGKKEMKKEINESIVAGMIRNRAKSLSVPTAWINSTLNKIALGEGDREEFKAELKLRYDLNESKASWVLLEGEEEKAEIIMATKDMVDRITGWLEDVAAMKAEQLLELTDSIGKALGSDVAQQYTEQVKPALEQVYSALEQTRSGLSGALALVSGGEAPMMGGAPGATEAPMPGGDEMGAELGGEMSPEVGAEELPPAGDEMAAGAEGGRMKRESKDYSRKLGMMLAQSKKK